MFIIAKPKTNHRHQLRAGLMGTLPKNTRRHMANNAAENQLPMAGFSGPLPKPDEPAIDPNLSRAEKFNLGIRRGNAIVRGPNSTLAKQFPIVPELVPEVAPEQENVLLPVPEPEPSLISVSPSETIKSPIKERKLPQIGSADLQPRTTGQIPLTTQKPTRATPALKLRPTAEERQSRIPDEMAGYVSAKVVKKPDLGLLVAQVPAALKSSQSTQNFTSPYTDDFKNKIHNLESNDLNYRSENKDKNNKSIALGRYQFTEIALEDIGMMKNGKWTGKYGIKSKDEFLDNGGVQERALADYSSRMKQQLKSKKTYIHVGKPITGIKGKFKITKGSLLAAAHRQGAGMVSQYLGHLAKNGYKSDPTSFPPKLRKKFLSVETRLRQFEKVTADKTP